MTKANTASSAAVQDALARLRRHAGTASVAAVLTPLALAPTPASAIIAVPTLPATITTETSATAGVTTFDYTVTNLDNSNSTLANNTKLDAFEIPEFNAGDLDIGSFTGPEGWSATVEPVATQLGTSFKIPALPGAYILVSTTTGDGLALNDPTTFSFTTTLTGTEGANFGGTIDAFNSFAESYVVNATGYVDPLVPVAGAPTSLPEPASMLVLGGGVLALGMTRARRKG